MLFYILLKEFVIEYPSVQRNTNENLFRLILQNTQSNYCSDLKMPHNIISMPQIEDSLRPHNSPKSLGLVKSYSQLHSLLNSRLFASIFMFLFWSQNEYFPVFLCHN